MNKYFKWFYENNPGWIYYTKRTFAWFTSYLPEIMKIIKRDNLMCYIDLEYKLMFENYRILENNR